MHLTIKSIPVLYAEVTQRKMTFEEIWRVVYYETFKPNRTQQWVTPAASDDTIPKWFYTTFQRLMDAEHNRHFPPAPTLDLRSRVGSAAVESLRANYTAEK